MSIEEAADKYEKANTGIYPEVGQTSIRDAFIDGYNLCREQMMKEAVEADVNIYRDIVVGKSWAEFVVEMPTNNLGDKVRIIVVKKD